MRPGIQNIIHDLLWEILLRVLLIGLVCICHLTIQPREYHITEAELLTHYKRPRHDSIVPSWAIVVIVVIVPVVFIYLVFATTKNYVDTVQAMLAWTLAMAITAALTESLKLSVGRPRPDYFYRCYPDGKMTTELLCNSRDVIEGRKSFPSGHSSFSFSSLGFISLWMCGKLQAVSSRGCTSKLLLCVSPLLVATGVALSRVYDNHHHWEDVFVGAILGLATSYFSYHQYYNPLDMQNAGEPLTSITQDELFESYELECCTRDLNEDLFRMLNLSRINNQEVIKNNC